MAKITLFTAKQYCHEQNCCPVAIADTETGLVTVSDPDKPERGEFKFTNNEWNALIANGKATTAKV